MYGDLSGLFTNKSIPLYFINVSYFFKKYLRRQAGLVIICSFSHGLTEQVLLISSRRNLADC